MLKNKLKKIAKEMFKNQEYSLYILGSLAYKDYIKNVSDIDLFVIFKEDLNDELYLKIKQFINKLKKDTNIKYDAVFCSYNQIDKNNSKVIYYNDEKFNFDNKCGNITPVNWYELKTIGILLFGNDIKNKTNTTVQEVLYYCKENINSYWENWVNKLENLDFKLSNEDLVWCALGISRIIYVLETNKLCSKTKAGKYAIKNFDKNFKPLLITALNIRKRKSLINSNEFKNILIDYMKFCIDRFNTKF